MDVQARWRLQIVAAVAALLSGCGSESGPAPPTAPPPSQPQRYGVSSVVDGDTIRFSPALLGSSSLRFLNIDAPEIGGDTQEPWAAASRAHLQQLLPAAAEIAIEMDQERTDAFARVLGHAIKADGLNVNREQLRLGHAVLYVIWPNVAHFSEYREAQIEAQASGRGVWSAAAPLREQPFEFRLRQDGALPFRPVGDFLTRSYVQPADYRLVHVNNRVFFNSPAAADAAGYRACPTDAAGAYSASCFAPGSAADRITAADRRRSKFNPRTRNSPIPIRAVPADRIRDRVHPRIGPVTRVHPRTVP